MIHNISNSNSNQKFNIFQDSSKKILYDFIKNQAHQQISSYNLSFQNIMNLFQPPHFKDYLTDMMLFIIYSNKQLHIIFQNKGDSRKKIIVKIITQIFKDILHNSDDKQHIDDMFIPFYICDTHYYHNEEIPFFVESKPRNAKGILFPDSSNFNIKLNNKIIHYNNFINILKHKKCTNIQDKKPIIYFSGADTGHNKHNIRWKLKEIIAENKDSNYKIHIDEGYYPMYDFCKYKYLLNLPGHQPWSYRLMKILPMGSLVIDVNVLQYFNETSNQHNEQWIQCYVDFFKKDIDYIQIDYPWIEKKTKNSNVYQLYEQINQIFNFFQQNSSKYNKITKSAVSKSNMLNEQVYHDTFIYLILIFNYHLYTKNNTNSIQPLLQFFLQHPICQNYIQTINL